MISSSEWISVNDSMPKIDDEVLILIPVVRRTVAESARYRGVGQFTGAWYSTRGKGCAYSVTHWMPRPANPQSKDNNNE